MSSSNTNWAPSVQQVWMAMKNLFPNHTIHSASLTLRHNDDKVAFITYDYPTQLNAESERIESRQATQSIG